MCGKIWDITKQEKENVQDFKLIVEKEKEIFICMACQEEKTNPTWWFKHMICGECHKKLKKRIYDCNSHELRIQGNFLLFLAGIKYSKEQEDKLKKKREQRKMLSSLN